MRILIVTHAPLTGAFGASQIAINLTEALRAQGHAVTLWSPQPLDTSTRWWRTIAAMRNRLDEFLKTQEVFDVIDCPPTLVTRLATRSATVVARSTQPDLLYLWTDFGRLKDRRFKSLLRLPFECAHRIYHMGLVLFGWARAKRIMCLGSLELRWMQRLFPWWRSKQVSYVVAPSEQEQRALAEVRHARQPRRSDHLRFLWIGRWAGHKGPDTLLRFIEQWSVQRPGDTFTIAGCGEGVEEKCPAELIRSDTIRIVPSYERADFWPLLANHDVGLFTSKVEGWGLSLNEMLESGMNVYANSAGGVPDLQPHFKSLIQFPPKPESGVATSVTEPGADYFAAFDWGRIATSYASEVELTKGKLLGRAAEPLPRQNEAAT